MIKTNKVETTITKLTTPKKKSQHLEDDSSASNSNQIQKKNRKRSATQTIRSRFKREYTTRHGRGNIELATDTENDESEITSTGGGVIIVIGRRRIWRWDRETKRETDDTEKNQREGKVTREKIQSLILTLSRLRYVIYSDIFENLKGH